MSDNKQIAKNTLFLYFRMILILIVTLYTSRVVLQQLGEDNYGIYSVIGGVVTFITFFNQAMCTSTQRYITYEIGKTHGNISMVFSTCVNIHLWIALGVILITETLGLWFVNNYMNFPIGSYRNVNWTYQLSILMCVITIIRFPYNALVLAHEKMSFFALNSIIEVLLKLGIVYLLIISENDKLILYMIMLTIVCFLITVWYIIYCRINFPNVSLIRVTNTKMYKEIISFSSWAMFGSMANAAYLQGTAIIINIFFGVIVNAALGISAQVHSAVVQLISGFQQAINPQLIKTQASGFRERQLALINTSSKFSFLIMLIIAYPLLCNLNYILSLWLNEYPEYTNAFTSWVIIGALIETFSGPLWVSIFATGKIKKYQISICVLLLLNVPFAYMIGYLNMPAWLILTFRSLIFLGVLLLQLYFLHRLIRLRISFYFKKVLLPSIIICTILALNLYCVRTYIIGQATDFIGLILQTLYFASFVLILELFIGLSREELNMIKRFVISRIPK